MIKLGATIRLKIEVEKELMEEREKKKNSQEEYAAQGLKDDYYVSKAEAQTHKPLLFAQSIVCKSRADLLNRRKGDHQQTIIHPTSREHKGTNKTPQFLPKLNLKTGKSNSNYLATAHAEDQLQWNLGQGWASNRIAPQIGRTIKGGVSICPHQ